MKNFYHYLLLLLTLFVNSDCSYQKRLYRKGYYVDWLSQKHSSSQKNFSSAQKENSFISIISIENTLPSFPSNFIPNHFQVQEEYSTVVASQQSTQHFIKNKSSLLQDTCGDKLILKSGDEYLVKIIEITEKEIKYKRCDNLDGPIYSVSKEKIYVIIYRNGYKEYIYTEQSSDDNVSKTSNKTKSYPVSLILALVFSGLTIIYIGIFLLPTIPFLARNARRLIQKYPDKYTGNGSAGCLMIGGIIVMFIFSAILGLLVYQSGGFVLLYSDAIFYSILFFISILTLIIFFATSKPKDFKE
ncbi:MAG: energy-coupling factor transporter transmembrane protein EcfT [Bacteroidia bacterium]|nr:energy-coupling factor transporter transmembrane protein EcfT [Bacteroidia bacterium]